MSDSESSDIVIDLEAVLDEVRPVERARRRGRGAADCGFCGLPNGGDVVDAGGSVGRVHRACFVLWDVEQEALEVGMSVAFALPDPLEEWAALDAAAAGGEGGPVRRAA